MIERPDVDGLMAGELGDFLNAQIAVREDAKAKTCSRYFICVIIGLPIVAFLLFSPLADLRYFIIAVGVMGALWWSRIPVNKAKKDTKSGINAAIAAALGLEYKHDCDEGHGFSRANQHKMFPSHDRARFEDLWCGTMAGKPFTLHEAHLEERRGSGKNRRWVSVFRGAIITIGFARDFHATTLVERSGRHQKFLFLGEKDEVKLAGQTLQKAEMVHPDFEDAFSVFTTDQTEARYLVHPTYIERLIALENAFRGKDIKTLFKYGELTIALKTANMFESGSLDHNRDRAMVEKCVGQFMAMADLCAQLNELDAD
ncbi:MAG: DUF3137 domain-containing protein [Alteraurantiacibacter sp.]